MFTKYNHEYDKVIIRLNFCVDKSIDLEIDGLLSDGPVINLAWGEIERIKEILWQKRDKKVFDAE